MEQRKMSKEEEINDSLEVCRDIYIYYKQREPTGTDGSGTSSSLYAAAYAAKKEPHQSQVVPLRKENVWKTKTETEVKADSGRIKQKPEKKQKSEQKQRPEQKQESVQGQKPEQKQESKQGQKPEQKQKSKQGQKPEQKQESERGQKPEQKQESEQKQNLEQEREQKQKQELEQEALKNVEERSVREARKEVQKQEEAKVQETADFVPKAKLEIKTRPRQKQRNWFKLELDPEPDGLEEEREEPETGQEREEKKSEEASLSEEQLAEEPEKVSSIIRNILSLFLCVLIAFVAARLLNQFIIQPTQVEGISMEDSLQNGEHLLMDKLSYRFHDPERFDIVIFPFEEGVYYIKRIIGLPGETVRILDGQVYIDGELLDEDIYGNTLIQNAGRAEEEILLGEEEYFVLGDNRNNSFDSRYEVVGNIDRKQLLGKVFFRIYPFSRFGLLESGKQKEKEEQTP